MEITYRRLVPADVAQYRPLRLQCLREFPNNFGANYDDELAKPKLAMETNIETGNPDVWLMGAFDAATLVGICGISRDMATKRRHIATVIQMYVQPSHSGRKIGLGLMNAAIVEAWKIPELEQLILEVVTSGQSAIRVYAEAGFEQFGFHKDFLKIGDRYEDALLMVRFRSPLLDKTLEIGDQLRL